MNKQYLKTMSLFLLISLSQGRDYIGFQINVNNNPFPANLFISTMGIEPRYLAILDTIQTHNEKFNKIISEKNNEIKK